MSRYRIYAYLEKDESKMKKGIYDNVKMVVLISLMTLLPMVYIKTQSKIFLTLMLSLFMGMWLYAVYTSKKLKKKKRSFYIYGAVSNFVISNVFLSIGLASYYVLLERNGIWLPSILIMVNVVLVFFSYVVFKGKLSGERNAKKLDKKFITSVSAVSGVIGLLMGSGLAKQLGEVKMLIALMVFTYFLSSIFVILSGQHLSIYILIKNNFDGLGKKY